MSGHRVTHEQLDYVGHHVRMRVRSGIPLDAVMRAYRTGFNTFWEECTAEVARRGLPRDAAVDLARKMSDAMDTLTTHAAAAYVREESYLRSVDEKAARDLLDALLRGDVDPRARRASQRRPGTRPAGGSRRRRRPCLDRERHPDDRARQRRGRARRRARHPARLPAPGRPRAGDRRGGAGGGPRPRARPSHVRPERSARTRHGVSLYCGLSSPCAGFTQVASAFEQASLAVARATEERPVVSLAALPALQHLLTGATGTTRAHLGGESSGHRRARSGRRRDPEADAARICPSRHERDPGRGRAADPREHAPLPAAPNP